MSFKILAFFLMHNKSIDEIVALVTMQALMVTIRQRKILKVGHIPGPAIPCVLGLNPQDKAH